MRPSTAETSQDADFTFQRKRKTLLQKVVGLPLQSIQELVSKSEVLKQALARGRDSDGFSVTAITEAASVMISIPPKSTLAREFYDRILSFTSSRVSVDEDPSHDVEHIIETIKSGSSYRIFPSLNYEIDVEGNLSNAVNPMNIDFECEVDIDEDNSKKIAEFVRKLKHFSQAESQDFLIIRDLVNWECAERCNLQQLQWEIDAKGHSQADVFPIEETDEAQLEWKKTHYKELYQQVLKVMQKLGSLDEILAEFAISRSARHFGEVQTAVITAIQAKTRQLIAEIESDMQWLFLFFARK